MVKKERDLEYFSKNENFLKGIYKEFKSTHEKITNLIGRHLQDMLSGCRWRCYSSSRASAGGFFATTAIFVLLSITAIIFDTIKYCINKSSA
jgi:hypothetical protein